MTFHVQTRGRTADYAFVGTAPSASWWREFQDFTSFESPTVLVQADGRRWKAYLSAIPSTRRDRVGTAIRYTLVADGSTSETTPAVAAVVARWTDDVAASRTSGELQKHLDELLTSYDVDELLTGKSPPKALQVQERLAEVLAGVSDCGVAGERPKYESWVGGVKSSDARGKFNTRVAELLSGRTAGVAALVNLIRTPEEAAPLLDRYSSVAVLLSDPTPSSIGGVAELKKKAPPRPRAARSEGTQMVPRSTAIFILLGVVLILVFWFLARTN